jgi:nucleoside-diphosphate-sugar epimerase
MKILITGYKGQVGSYFTKTLQNHELTLIDIRDGNDAIDFFKNDNTKFDISINLAANVGGRSMIDGQPWKLFTNFSIDSEYFQWALRTKPNKVIYYSSSAAYPMELQFKDSGIKMKEQAINLSNIGTPDESIYGISKLTGEHLAEYAAREGLNIWTFRPFSGYSETQGADYPFCSLVERVKRNDDPLVIWGPDGEQVRDFIHMQDVIDGTLAIINDAPPSQYNLCTGIPTSMNDLSKKMIKMFGRDFPEFKYLKDKPVGVQYRVGDPIKMLEWYKPKISLEEGIARALRS